MNDLSLSNSVLLKIDPKKIEAYLYKKGWKQKSHREGVASIWEIEKEGKSYKVIILLDTKFVDFVTRTEMALEVLSEIEKRSQSEILKNLENFEITAREARRDILSVRLYQNFDRKEMEMKAIKLGKFLRATQDLFDEIGKSKIGNSAKTREKLELSVIDTFEGSFGIKIALPPASHLQQLSLFEGEKPTNWQSEEVLSCFFRIVELTKKSQMDSLRAIFSELKGKAAACYRVFLSSLLDMGCNLDLEWGSPNPEKGGEISLSLVDASEAFADTDETSEEPPSEFVVIGKLVLTGQGDEENRRFSIETFDGKIYSGEISSFNLCSSLQDAIGA